MCLLECRPVATSSSGHEMIVLAVIRCGPSARTSLWLGSLVCFDWIVMTYASVLDPEVGISVTEVEMQIDGQEVITVVFSGTGR